QLADFSIALIQFLMDAFGITTKTVRATSLDLDLSLRSSDMILQMLRRVGADVYLAGPSGRKYMDTESFERSGIGLEFQRFEHPRYRQLFGEFVPNMAAVDLLFNEGESAGRLFRSAPGAGRLIGAA